MLTMLAKTSTDAATVAKLMSGYAGVIAGFIVVISIIAAIYYVLLVIAWWKLFTKAGEKGWKAIIPFYNYYIQCKLTWATKWFWITIGLAVVSGILGAITTGQTDVFHVIVAFVDIAICIAVLVLSIISCYRLAKAYGHGGGYTVGLVFLNFIFMLILGFGKSKYQGNVYLKARTPKH